ncbi:TM2 domain-containing protein [Berryella wangjianweii]|uniref:TM2 domain-containing protein n=1 Tax=Berryella wangjianweii TaxID=2734634 RepID=A0A6M8J2X2_9ACTN|nr:TM2 domain-containing protein [Berryella wangjianweii]QKF07461.1 TM2 domain-containing protein [Berryella wangjianweii]
MTEAQPCTFRPPKRRATAVALAFLFGPFGLHKFYLGYFQAAFIMLTCSVVGGIVTLGLGTAIVWVVAIVEGFAYLARSDDEFQRIYVQAAREWF